MNRFFLNALFGHRSPYTAVLPYNLNWMIGRGDILSKYHPREPITLVDVGARGGLPGELHPIRHMIRHIGFDADPAECARLNAERSEGASREVFPYFIGASVGSTEFHVYTNPGESSALKPDLRHARLFGGSEIARTIPVEMTTLDAFFRDRPMRRPDMLKLDTQGTELDILRAAPECLKTASLVEAEVEFCPFYQDQPLFHHVLEFMLDRGFELLYLNRFFQQRRGYPGWARGQILFGDALFGRREDGLDDLDEQRVVNYVILLINYGHLDLAYQIVQSRQIERGTREFFASYLQSRVGGWTRMRVRKAVNPLIDKLVLFLLHFRKHNALILDSDRAWPLR